MPASRYLIGQLPWYSVLVVTGMMLAILWACLEEKRMGMPKDTAIDLALCCLPAGIVGARIYFVLFSWKSFIGDPWAVLRIWEGGLGIYGGILAGALAACLYCRRKKLSFLQVGDMLVPGVALAQAIGRWGNFFNMEAYGQPVAMSVWQFFPVAVLIPEGSGLVWHQATFFYESCWDLVIFLILVRASRREHPRGHILLLYALLYGVGRQVIEGMRMDSLMLHGIRVSQGLAMLLALLALTLHSIAGKRTGKSKLLLAAAWGSALVILGIGLFRGNGNTLIQALWGMLLMLLWLENTGKSSVTKT